MLSDLQTASTAEVISMTAYCDVSRFLIV